MIAGNSPRSQEDPPQNCPTVGLGLIIGLLPLQRLPRLDPLAPLLRLGFQLLSLRRPDLQPDA